MTALAVGPLLALAACGDAPTAVELQVIEEVEFAATLGIDLASFTRLESGAYVQDVVVGTGEAVGAGDFVTVTYAGYLADGSTFGSGDQSFVLGSGAVIEGFDAGVRGMQPGGERRVIIPPQLAYGTQARTDETGAVIIPAGSVLIFDLTLAGVS